MGSGLPSQRQCTALLLLLPSAFANAAAPTNTTTVHWRRGPLPPTAAMSVGPQRKSIKGVRVVSAGRERKGKVESSPANTAMSCFFCKETNPTSAVSSSLLESIMKVKSYMCIPLQLCDQPVSDIVLCSKCLDIISQIEGWIDLLRQRIFDSHEGAVLYPETPLWLQALAASASATSHPKAAAVNRVVTPSISAASNSIASAGEKRKIAVATAGGQAPVPPKKMAAAAATAAAATATATAAAAACRKDDGVSYLSLPISAADLAAANAPALPFITVPVSSAETVVRDTTTANTFATAAALNKSAMRSAIDSLTSLVNVVRTSPKGRAPASTEASNVSKAASNNKETTVVKEEPANSHDESNSPILPFDIPLRWCSVCSSSYHNDSVFKRHIVSIHPELCFKCELCGQLFATASSRDIHVSHGCCERPTNRTRVLRCTDCHATFLGKYELKRHVLLTSHMGGVSGQT